MYQNAPPPHAYNQGYGAPPQQYGGGGYYNNDNIPQQQQQHPPPAYPGGNQYGAPSPVNAAYQRANAAMAGRGTDGPNPGNNSAGGGAFSSGLIRLSLRKPMGIVFEPMTDPHNPSQQRGVRICDLPRTGAAAMSQKLEVGDELLSINDKTMSRLTFDEIMDFIIEADKERVDLLFRRPGKDKLNNAKGGAANAPAGAPGQPLSPMGIGGVGSANSNSVKWIDEKSEMGGKLAQSVQGSERSSRNSGRGEKAAQRQDDPSVDDTYNDGYTVESQSQYTMETYEEDRRRGGRKGSRRDGKKSDRHHRDEKRKADPVESSGFLDLLIDTLCTSVIGRDARDMCVDPNDRSRSKKSGKSDYDDDFTVDDDGTYATYEENPRHRSHRKDTGDQVSYVTEDEQTFVTMEDDGTLESRQQPQKISSKDLHSASHSSDKKSKDQLKTASSKSSKSKDQLADVAHLSLNDDGMGQQDMDQSHQYHDRADPPPNYRDDSGQAAPDPPTKSQQGTSFPLDQQFPQDVHQPPMDYPAGEQESAVASGIALPLKELEYDDRVDYAADVSVMESLGGPSLLVERARHENAVTTGHDRASFENLERQDPELAELVAAHGDGFVPDPGMTKEETAFRDPYKFYEHAVCRLLQDNEPEKVRLLSKLMAKYRGRERHLINKLSARYNKDRQQGQDGNAAGSGNDGVGGAVATSGSMKSTDNNSTLANKPSMVSGMEKIHEGGEDEEAGSSVLNDPSRANIAAIESAKKKLEITREVSGNESPTQAASPKAKSSNDDGWPPAMADPWGTGDHEDNNDDPAANNGDEDGSRQMDEEGSFSDGSSYSDGSGIDGTSPAIIAQVSELLNYVYGKTSVAGQIDRVSTIMRAYEGREAVLLELLETKALIKANADSNRDDSDLPMSLRNSPNLNNAGATPAAKGEGNNSNTAGTPSTSEKKQTPETPMSGLTAPTMEYANGPTSPASVASPKEATSPSAGTLNTLNTTASKKKKKGIFGGFFGGKKKDKKGNFPSDSTAKTKSKKTSKKGQPLNEDDRSI